MEQRAAETPALKPAAPQETPAAGLTAPDAARPQPGSLTRPPADNHAGPQAVAFIRPQADTDAVQQVVDLAALPGAGVVSPQAPQLAAPQRLRLRPAGRAPLLPRLRQALGQPGLTMTSDFDLNPGTRPPAAPLRAAGVLIAITPDEELILTKRSSHLKHHPGQIAFPGGKVDPEDSGPVGAALREAEEEVGLPRHQAEVLGTLPQHITITSFAVTPVVALVPGFNVVPEAGEVEEVFRVPLAHVLDPDNYQVQYRAWQGGRRGYYAVPYGPYYIWGATARMLRVLAAVMT